MPQFESHFFSSLIFWEIVSFAILLFVLYKFAFPGILGVLEELAKLDALRPELRRQEIEDGQLHPGLVQRLEDLADSI